METGQNQYDILIQAITEYTAKLDEITNKIEKIKLSAKEQEEFNNIVESYDGKELMTKYIEDVSQKHDKKTKLYKYLQLYKEGIATNEELEQLVNVVAQMGNE